MRRNIALTLPAKNARRLGKTMRLCYHCLQRQGVSSTEARSMQVDAPECQICAGLIANLSKISHSITRRLEAYEFESFLVGAYLSQELLDKEDEIRSRLKIRGREGIKTQITRTISGEIAKRTGKKLNYALPDITLLVSLADGSVSFTPRSIWLMARYRKTIRGVAQRSSTCKICNGIGCAACNYNGFAKSSVQLLVSQFLSKMFRAENCGFIWIGSEDEKSLVGGDGRPFFVEVQKPKKRKISPQRLSRTVDLNGMILSSLEVLPSRPKSIPQFTMKCRVYLSKKDSYEKQTEPKVMKEELESKFNDSMVRVRISRKSKIVSRKIYSIVARLHERDHPCLLEIECEGGIPIRKLVSGSDDTVLPNLSSYLSGLTLDPEMPFDITDIILTASKEQKDIGHGTAEPNQNSTAGRRPKDLRIRETLEDSQLIMEDA